MQQELIQPPEDQQVRQNFYGFVDNILEAQNPVDYAEDLIAEWTNPDGNFYSAKAVYGKGIQALFTAANTLMLYQHGGQLARTKDDEAWLESLEALSFIVDKIKGQKLSPSFGTVRFKPKAILDRLGRRKKPFEFEFFTFKQPPQEAEINFEEVDEFLLSADVRESLETVLKFTAGQPQIFAGMTLLVLSNLGIQKNIRECGHYRADENVATIYNTSVGSIKHELGHFAMEKATGGSDTRLLPIIDEGIAQTFEIQANPLDLLMVLDELPLASTRDFNYENVRKNILLEWMDVNSLFVDFPNAQISRSYLFSAIIFNALLAHYTRISKNNTNKSYPFFYRSITNFKQAIIDYQDALSPFQQSVAPEEYLKVWETLFESHMGMSLPEAIQLGNDFLKQVDF